ncbi:MAG TPA: glycosyl hydrolase family 28 protein [Polyangiaceae bacterium]
MAIVLGASIAWLVGASGCGGKNLPSQGTYTPPGSSSSSGAASSSGSSSSSGGSPTDDDAATDDVDAGPCGAGDTNLPPEPTIPPACVVLQATQSVTNGANPTEDTLDTASIQAALSACPAGQAVELTTNGANNAFVTGPLQLPNGVTLWVDAGTTLYASRNPANYGSACGTTTGACTPLISTGTQNNGIVGDGVIDGQGGEQMIGTTMSWWDLTNASAGASGNPPLIQVKNTQNFTLYRITLHNAPKFHVKLGAVGFVVWGVTVLTPSKTMNAAGTALSAAKAPNTDGIDPGEFAQNGYIVCNKISDGDDQIAIKGGTNVTNVTIAHNHFGAGHGMSIGSETNGGVSNVNVYDLSIDGTNSGMKGGASNGIRIKSDPTQGGLVTGITYSDVCIRNVSNPIIMNPTYSATTGPLPPTFTNITIKDFHEQTSTLATTVTVKGFDATHLTNLTLDNVVFDDVPAISAANANVTLGPGNVNFMPSGAGVDVTNQITAPSPAANTCAGKWITF